MREQQDYSVIYRQENNDYYVEGSGMVRLDADTFIAVVPVVPRGGTFTGEALKKERVRASVTNIVKSVDGGKTWETVSALPYYSAAPWVYGETLYLFANKGGYQYRNDDFLLLCSKDAGHSWSEPVTLFEGHFWNAHTAMVIKDEKLYWATDDLSFGPHRGPRLVVGDLTGDIMDAKSWQMSNPVPFLGVPETLVNPQFADFHRRSLYLEPNVILRGGKIQVLATVKPKGQRTTGLCAVFDTERADGEYRLSFSHYHPMPGGQLKFFVTWDEESKLFWAAVNLPVDGEDIYMFDNEFEEKSMPDQRGGCRYFTGGNDRRFLMLMYGADGLNWFQAGCIARADKIWQSFMYPAIVIDGGDLCVIARSSINALNRHDADHATFHRITNFRELAMDLYPKN